MQNKRGVEGEGRDSVGRPVAKKTSAQSKGKTAKREQIIGLGRTRGRKRYGRAEKRFATGYPASAKPGTKPAEVELSGSLFRPKRNKKDQPTDDDR